MSEVVPDRFVSANTTVHLMESPLQRNKRTPLVAMVFFILGVVLVLHGMNVLLGDNTRRQAVAEYNAAVQNWNRIPDGGRARFAAFRAKAQDDGWSVSTANDTTSAATVVWREMRADEQADVLTDGGGDLMTYRALKHTVVFPERTVPWDVGVRKLVVSLIRRKDKKDNGSQSAEEPKAGPEDGTLLSISAPYMSESVVPFLSVLSLCLNLPSPLIAGPN